MMDAKRALTDAGIAVLRFDFTGLGQSEGDFADTNFSSNVSDLLAAVRFLDDNYRAGDWVPAWGDTRKQLIFSRNLLQGVRTGAQFLRTQCI